MILPKYAILSHTWLPNSRNGVEEVVYAEIKSRDSRRKLSRGHIKQAGFSKLWELCNTANREGYQYVWMDTCCINKESRRHTEMAINNMKHYYSRAAMCYAYLGDVSLPEIENARWPEGGLKETSSTIPAHFRRTVEKAQWFSRVWTLQELMAPRLLQFLDKNWKLIGTKQQWSTVIRNATGLQANHLTGGLQQNEVMAQKFHWASKRRATMQEDQAYGLLGLFDIKIDVRYGEELDAFHRLQVMLISRGEPMADSTILGWRAKSSHSSQSLGVLAPSLKYFCHEGQIVPAYRNPGIRWDNGSVVIRAFLWEKQPKKKNIYFAAFMYRAADVPNSNGPSLGIYLKKVGQSETNTLYRRIRHKASLIGPNNRSQYSRVGVRSSVTIVDKM